jgi:ParB family chromosome partitioning protein
MKMEKKQSMEIPIDKVKVVENVRLNVKQGELSELMQNIKHNGLLQDIGVWETESGEYIIAYGNRRLIACQKLGWRTIPAKILGDLTDSDLLILNVSENLHRKNISVAELGRVCDLLRRQGLSNSEIATRLGLPLERVRLALDIFGTVPKELRGDIVFLDNREKAKKGKISANTYKAIMSLDRSLNLNRPDVAKILRVVKQEEIPLDKIRLFGQFIKQGMSVDKGLKSINSCEVIQVNLAYNKDRARELIEETGATMTNHNLGRYIRSILYGKIPCPEGLFVDKYNK